MTARLCSETHTHARTHSVGVGVVHRGRRLAEGRWVWAEPEQDSGEEAALLRVDQDLHAVLNTKQKTHQFTYINSLEYET